MNAFSPISVEIVIREGAIHVAQGRMAGSSKSMKPWLPGLFMLVLAASPACAEDRDFCANRPGLNTPACTLAPGDSMAEVGLLAWDHQADAVSRDDILTMGDMTFRLGITTRSELELSFTGYVHDRFRDKASGTVSAASSTGDATVAWRRGIAGPNGPIAIEAYVSLPVGKSPGGAGDWAAGVLMPMGFDLGQGFQFSLTPEADAAVNASGSGRHFAFGPAQRGFRMRWANRSRLRLRPICSGISTPRATILWRRQLPRLHGRRGRHFS